MLRDAPIYEKLAPQEARRMKSSSSITCHELRAPVTAIMGFDKVNQLADDLGPGAARGQQRDREPELPTPARVHQQ